MWYDPPQLRSLNEDIMAALVNGGFHKAIDEVLKLLTPAAPAFSVINATYKTIGYSTHKGWQGKPESAQEPKNGRMDRGST